LTVFDRHHFLGLDVVAHGTNGQCGNTVFGGQTVKTSGLHLDRQESVAFQDTEVLGYKYG
jgi:hypothetical protein